ncbi:spore coat protein U domain-containing protein [Sphingorhabdus sp.]|uniref:spore coat protein U domain-containing protein n=1 Tax=Sphingorhabdus sp. TaxID=1902408 RepID=UPI00333F65CF
MLALLPVQAVAASEATCHLTVTAMNFGAYSPLATRPMDFTADVSVLCTAPDETTIPVAGSIRLIADDASGAPHLESGRKKLRYQLFVDAARSVPWTSSLSPPEFSGLVSGALPFRHRMTIYGRIQARQFEPGVGYYEDAIAVVLNY